MPEVLTIESRREHVAKMVKNGLPTKVIAKRLNIPLATVLADKLHLSVPNPEELTKSSVYTASTGSAVAPTTENNRKRREDVRDLFGKGWNDAQIAELLNVSVMTVWRDREALELRRETDAEVSQRRMMVKELLEQNVHVNDIAEQAGVSVMTVIRDRRYLGYDDALEIRSSAIDSRRAKIARMVEAGMPCNAIARELGLESRVVRYDCEQMGILNKVPKSDYSMRSRKRKEDIIEMYQTEPNIQRIANHFKVHPATVKRALASQLEQKTA